MSALEAVPLVFAFLLAVYLAVSNFLQTVQGYLAVIDARTSLLEKALLADQKALFATRTAKDVIGPYTYNCNAEFLGYGGIAAYLADGYVGITVPMGSVLGNEYKDYLLLVPSPSYFTRRTTPTAKALVCHQDGELRRDGVGGFLVLPNGTVLVG